MTLSQLESVSSICSCFRCGREFRPADGSRTCDACLAAGAEHKSVSPPKLSCREKQVVHLVAKAKQNKEIAHELNLTEGTIKEYMNRIFRKVGTSNRTELAVWALTGGLRMDEKVA